MANKKIKTMITSLMLFGAFFTINLLPSTVLALGNVYSGKEVSNLTKTTSVSKSKIFKEQFKDYNVNDWLKADGWSNGAPFDCTWRANNVNFDNGIMTLTLNNDTQGGTTPYAGAEYRTNDTYGYGLYKVNMKPAKNPGIVSSFFTYTGPYDNTPWDEIDIEFLGKDTTKVQFNYFTNGVGNHEFIYDLGFDASTSYHTYAFDWQPTYIAWFVDGKEVHRATNDIPTHPGKIMMNLWPGIGVDAWLGEYNGVPVNAYYDWMSYKPTR